MTRDELLQLLDARLADPSVTTGQDAEIWERYGADRAVLVLDLAGFSRLMRTRGVLHFLAVYKRAINIATPACDRHGGRVVKCEPDNLIASFDTPAGAVLAARAINDECAALDDSLSEDHRVQVCMAIGWGKVLELVDDVYGDDVMATFLLVTRATRARELLLTEAARARLLRDGRAIEGEEKTFEPTGVRYFHVRW